VGNSLGNINHIIVLMLENRSFDNVLGALYPNSAAFNGLVPNATAYNINLQTGDVCWAWNQPGTDVDTVTIPNPDPGEAFQDMNYQLFGTTLQPGQSPSIASMGGFVADYGPVPPYPSGLPNGGEWPTLPRTRSDGTLANPCDVMHYFTTVPAGGQAAQMPVTGQLAQAFGVSDCWFASAPTQTWPNRFFLNCASSAGGVDNVDYTNQGFLHIPLQSVFELLDGGGSPSPANWKVYYSDAAIAWTIEYVWKAYGNATGNTVSYQLQFENDCQSGNLPKYALIEPQYTSFLGIPNSNHPPYDVTYGEILLADVYNTLRSSPSWSDSLLLVIYDEHGGCYDHMMPPTNATAPGQGWTLPTPSWFGFNRFGVRVPALLICPFVPAGIIFRPAGYANGGYNRVIPYDHTTVIATLNERFNVGTLTARDAAAPSLGDVLTLPSSTANNGPAHVTPPTPSDPAASLAIAKTAPHQYDPALVALMLEAGIRVPPKL
jgi:phospholipase C